MSIVQSDLENKPFEVHTQVAIHDSEIIQLIEVHHLISCSHSIITYRVLVRFEEQELSSDLTNVQLHAVALRCLELFLVLPVNHLLFSMYSDRVAANPGTRCA